MVHIEVGVMKINNYFSFENKNTREWIQIIGWCSHYFGPCGTDEEFSIPIDKRWYVGSSQKFWFRDEKDFIMVVLRWA